MDRWDDLWRAGGLACMVGALVQEGAMELHKIGDRSRGDFEVNELASRLAGQEMWRRFTDRWTAESAFLQALETPAARQARLSRMNGTSIKKGRTDETP